MSQKNFFFELITQDNKARYGKINTAKGIVETPAFMPVGTQGTVKGVFSEDIIKTGSQIILGNYWKKNSTGRCRHEQMFLDIFVKKLQEDANTANEL